MSLLWPVTDFLLCPVRLNMLQPGCSRDLLIESYLFAVEIFRTGKF